MNNEKITGKTSRRQFIKTSGALVATGAMMSQAPFILTGKAAFAGTLKVGLIGCGGRGVGAAMQALNADPNVELTAMGDVFNFRAEGALKQLKNNEKLAPRVKVTPETTFIGLDAYKKVTDSVDVVLLTTPPGFRPPHLEYAVEKGKHVFCEKPMAVDAVGYRQALAAAHKAKEKNLSLVAGFCWRYGAPEREIMERVLRGDIGDVKAVYSTYNTGPLWCYPRQAEWSDLFYQMRNWYYFSWISGDHIVEQACHSVDKLMWALGDQEPVCALAHGGRQQRVEKQYGNIYDHFFVVYDFKGGERGFLACRQMANCSGGNDDYIIGTKGYAKIQAFGSEEITGENPWRLAGKDRNSFSINVRKQHPDMYQQEHNELFKSIRNGDAKNDGEWMMRSSLMAVMGRESAYTGKRLTWEDIKNSQQKLMPENLAWDMELPEPPIPMPGRTEFI